MLETAFVTASTTCVTTTCYRLLAIFTVAGALIWGRTSKLDSGEGRALKKRFFTYTVIASLTIVASYLGALFFIGYVSLLALGCISELFTIVNPKQFRSYQYLAFALSIATIATAVFLSAHYATKSALPLFYLIPPLTIAIAACTPVLLQSHKNILPNVFCTVFGTVYFAWFLSHLLLIRSLENGFGLIVFLGMCVSLNDIFAYAIGRSIGKSKMSPIVSPSKTWEGFFGGALGTILAAVVFHYAVSAISIYTIASLTAVIIVAAPMGDLVISAIKREYAIKDSGSLLPGHGGLLDRCDSLILTAPVFYYVLTLGL